MQPDTHPKDWRQRKDWRERKDWASGRLDSQMGGRATVFCLWVFVIVWNAFSWTVAIAAANGHTTGDTGLAPLFPAIGVGLFAIAIYVTLQYKKWGRSRLDLLTLPGVLGGPLRCVLYRGTGVGRSGGVGGEPRLFRGGTGPRADTSLMWVLV